MEAKSSVLRTYEVKQSKEMESFERSAILALEYLRCTLTGSYLCKYGKM
jgi:hypothetical protein